MRGYKKDRNHNEIKAYAQRLGCSVADTASQGGGFPDMVVGVQGLTVLTANPDEARKALESVPTVRAVHEGANLMVEAKHRKEGRLTGDQVRFHREWRGQIAVITDMRETLNMLGY